MPTIQSILFLLLLVQSIFLLSSPAEFREYTNYPRLFSAQDPSTKTVNRLSKPLIGNDGRIYTCSEKNLFAFESNGSIAWTLHLHYMCNVGIAPIHGGKGKIYLVAENRVLKIDFSKIGTSESAIEVFFGPEPGQKEPGEIIGLSVSTLSSSVFINIKNRGLFAYLMGGKLLWSAGPILNQFGHRQGCRKSVDDCYFTSVPVIDQCEATIYISNTEGEVYCLSIRSPQFKWIQDFSSFDKVFTITPGNNGRLYVTVPVRALVLALDVCSGNVLWQRSIGPLSTAESAPVVDSNGWLSIGSLDGFLYSFSPTGALKKFPKTATVDSVVQVSPLLDCSGYAVYISQTQMDGKTSRTIGEYTYVSTMRPKNIVFKLLVPATGFIYWSESYPGKFLSSLSESDLHNFTLDERILLAFLAASKTGNRLPCRTTSAKLASSCSHARLKHLSIYTGNERAILLFLLFESVILLVLAVLVRFCCIFWKKKKLQGQDLGIFLEKRRSLQLKKKAFDRTITELEQKAAEEAVANGVLETLGDLVQEREGIKRKLSTTYSLGRDYAGSHSKSLLPLSDGKTRSYSFQIAKKESVTLFHTLSDTSSRESSSESESSLNFHEDKSKGKAKAHVESESSSDGEIFERDYRRSPSEPASSFKGFMSIFGARVEKLHDQEQEVESSSKRILLKRRRTFSSTN